MLYPLFRRVPGGAVILATVGLVLFTGHPAAAQICNEVDRLFGKEINGGEDFGWSIAMADGLIVVGAADDNANGAGGSAHLFDASNGRQLARVQADDGHRNNSFGFAAAIDNGLLAVGAHRDNNEQNSGSAYLFDTSDPANPTLASKVVPTNGQSGESFGWDLAMKADLLVVGAFLHDGEQLSSGAVYLYDVTDPTDPTPLSKIVPDDGVESGWFGMTISVRENLLAVGAPGDTENGFRSGSVYFFNIEDPRNPTQIEKLQPSDGGEKDMFGFSIGIHDDLIAIGAPVDAFTERPGSAYLFDASTRERIAKLEPDPQITGQDRFGQSIAIQDGNVVVGAVDDADNGRDAGAAYLFDITNPSNPLRVAKLLPIDNKRRDDFGRSVAMFEGLIGIGAPSADHRGFDSGSVYLFDADCAPSCLRLRVESDAANRRARFTIENGTPGTRAITVFGRGFGKTVIEHEAGYCATFGIKGIDKSRIVGGFHHRFNKNGRITFEARIPRSAVDQRFFFQAAERGTCPEECVSDLLFRRMR